MKTIAIPGTELRVSALALGTMDLGASGCAVSSFLDAALGNGINHLDLADIYARGRSEQCLGNALRRRPGMRQRLVLQTKCGVVLPDEQGPQRYDLSRDHILNSVEGSLGRLGTDHIDLLCLHRPDLLVEPDEIAAAFDVLQRDGKVRYFGVSNHSPQQIRLLESGLDLPLVVNQVQISLGHPHHLFDGMVEFCRRRSIQLQAWSPLARGHLLQQETLSGRLATVARAQGVSVEAVALSWLLHHPAGIQPIIGTTDQERLARCCAADGDLLDRADWYGLLESARGAPVP